MTKRLLDVSGELKISIRGQEVTVIADDGSILVLISSLASGFQLFRALGVMRPTRKRLAKAACWLTGSGLTLSVRTPRGELLRIGAAGNSWVLKLIGL